MARLYAAQWLERRRGLLESIVVPNCNSSDVITVKRSKLRDIFPGIYQVRNIVRMLRILP